MSTGKQRVLQPQYMKDFICIGGKCEDSCCIGWQVTIDQKTYKKYKKCKDQELARAMNKYVGRNRSNVNEYNYARIRLDDDGSCPFLDEEKLCCIQKRIGEDYLSITCSTYPRTFNLVNGTLERSATLSCPEIARKVLLVKDPMEFDLIEETIGDKLMLQKSIDEEYGTKIQKHFWELRSFVIELLQNRDFGLWERLIVLGIFVNKVDKLNDENSLADLSNLINSFKQMLGDGTFNDYLANLPTQSTIQMQLIKELLDERVWQGINTKRYLECIEEVIKGINYDDQLTIEEIGEHYKNIYEQYYVPFMLEREYLLENYLVNYIFKSLFPSSPANICEEYLIMVVHYSMIKMQLIGLAGYHKESFDEEHIIKLIQSFSKAVEHNTSFISYMIDLLRENNFDSLAHMAILIKN
ncbi:MAG: flagellin lysine-N-methylase [Desulfitobacterium hafniense]|nr:flagellin lysine-N-methylase [Desulfitobacterium hafniense]